MEQLKGRVLWYLITSYTNVFFADKKKKTFAADRIVVHEKDVSVMLKKVHDEAGHVGIGNTRRNCKKSDSFKI